VAFAQELSLLSTPLKEIDWSAAFARDEFFWIPPTQSGAEALDESLKTLEILLPRPHAVHVLAAPAMPKSGEELSLGGKKLLVISTSSGLRDYIFLEKFFSDAPLESLSVRAENCRRIASFSDRLLEDSLRRSGDLKIFREALSTAPERYARILEKSRKPQKLLLHVCCGPDAAGVVQQLKSEFDLTCFWYDPNIQPRQEHDKRLAAFVKVMEIEKVPYVVGEYDVTNFLDRIKGLEHTPEQGAKCSKCYDMRLERAALEARDTNFDLYATTLAISPHKVQQKLVAFGELNEKRYGVPYFHRNFMKDDGFVDATTYTREHGIFRQDYCGCWFSLHEGGPAAQWLGSELGLKPDSKTAPEELEDAVFKNYEARLVAGPDSGYSGG